MRSRIGLIFCICYYFWVTNYSVIGPFKINIYFVQFLWGESDSAVQFWPRMPHEIIVNLSVRATVLSEDTTGKDLLTSLFMSLLTVLSSSMAISWKLSFFTHGISIGLLTIQHRVFQQEERTWACAWFLSFYSHSPFLIDGLEAFWLQHNMWRQQSY